MSFLRAVSFVYRLQAWLRFLSPKASALNGKLGVLGSPLTLALADAQRGQNLAQLVTP